MRAADDLLCSSPIAGTRKILSSGGENSGRLSIEFSGSLGVREGKP